MKNKKIIFIILLCIVVTLNMLLFCFPKKSNSIQINEDVAIMVYNTASHNYISQNSIPTGNYALDTNLSYCEGTGEIQTYDNTNGTLTSVIDGQDKCYYYFYPSVTLTFTGGVYSNYNTYCQQQYSLDGGTTFYDVDIPSKSGTVIKLPIGAIIKIISNGPYNPYYCNVLFCTTSDCYATENTYNARDIYYSPSHYPVNYTITGNETYYSTFAGTCFDENTLIEVWDRKKKKRRRKKIKDILVGDIVYTYDYELNIVVTSKVKNITINKTREIYRLIFDNDEIITTADHPLCVSGAGYVNASELKKGYKIMSSDGKSYMLKDVIVESLDYEKEMYCLELEDGHSLLVGKNGYVALSMYASVLLVMGLLVKPMNAFAVAS